LIVLLFSAKCLTLSNLVKSEQLGDPVAITVKNRYPKAVTLFTVDQSGSDQRLIKISTNTDKQLAPIAIGTPLRAYLGSELISEFQNAEDSGKIWTIEACE
jgi:hypothetical protein